MLPNAGLMVLKGHVLWYFEIPGDYRFCFIVIHGGIRCSTVELVCNHYPKDEWQVQSCTRLFDLTQCYSNVVLDWKILNIKLRCTSLSSLPLCTDAVDLGSPEELMEISEVDEGICTQAAMKDGSPPIIVVSSTNVTPNIGKTAGKGLRRLTGSKSSKDKEREKEGEVSNKQSCGRAMSENLELLSLKRLTLTSSQSVPKGGALSLSRTASAAFSRSFEQVSNALGVTNRASSPASNHSPKENRHSACSLQEETYVEHLSPANISLQLGPNAWPWWWPALRPAEFWAILSTGVLKVLAGSFFEDSRDHSCPLVAK